MRFVKPLLIAGAAMLAGLAGPAAAQKAQPAKIFSGKQETEIRRLVREYLIQHPEVIIEAMNEYRRRQKEAQARKTAAAIGQHRQSLLKDATSPVGGNAKGDITIVEFFDYRCGYCKAVHPQLSAFLRQDGNVRVVYKEFPILGPASLFASQAAVAAQRQGNAAYLKFHDALMTERDITPESVMAIAKRVGLDVEKLAKDMKRPEVTAVLRANHELAQKLGIRGTPAFIIGNELVPGAIPAEQMAEKVAKARTVCKKSKAALC